MKTGILVGYFAKRDETRDAIRKLRRKGYHRIAWVSKNADDGIRTGDLFFWRQIFWAAVAFILFGTIAAGVSLSFQWPAAGRWPAVLVSSVANGVLGALLGAAWFRRSRFGVERRLLADHARWLVAGETALLLQAPIEKLRLPVTVLLESGEIPPAVFVLHPQRQSPEQAQEARGPGGTPLSPAQLQEHARRLAAEHQLDARPLRNTELLKRLDRVRRWVAQVCLDLSEAAHLQQSVPPTAEWLLDNEYILESNARDVRLNLPWAYYRQLPALAGEPDRAMPRIYGLARELADHTELLLDEENIQAFIEAYQSVTPLSIGELWAVPQMLRMVLIEGIGQLASRALTELREQELADIWANRLIMTNRRDPNQLFSIMAQLTETHPNPSPFFASQLIDYLYDEGAALVPVQGWLERTFHKSLHDLILRVKTGQTKDQIAIGNAFTSLRQLDRLDWKECFERLSRVEQALRQDPAGIYPQMDFATRDRYRRTIEDLRRGSGLDEEQIAQRAIELAAESTLESAADERAAHVGTYLVGEGRGALARLIDSRETLRFRACTGLMSITRRFTLSGWPFSPSRLLAWPSGWAYGPTAWGLS